MENIFYHRAIDSHFFLFFLHGLTYTSFIEHFKLKNVLFYFFQSMTRNKIAINCFPIRLLFPCHKSADYKQANKTYSIRSF